MFLGCGCAQTLFFTTIPAPKCIKTMCFFTVVWECPAYHTKARKPGVLQQNAGAAARKYCARMPKYRVHAEAKK